MPVRNLIISLLRGSLALAFAAITGCASVGSLTENPVAQNHQDISRKLSRSYESPIPPVDRSHRTMVAQPGEVRQAAIVISGLSAIDTFLSGMPTMSGLRPGPSNTALSNAIQGLDSAVRVMPRVRVMRSPMQMGSPLH